MREAERILEEAYVIDGHHDLGMTLELKHKHGEKNVLMNDYYESCKEGRVDCLIAAMYVDSDDLPDHGIAHIMEQISLIYDEVASTNGKFVIVRNTGEMLKAKANGQIALLIAIEGAEAIEGRISILSALYELGLRVISPCWSRTSWAADGSRFLPVGEYVGTGLTEAGAEMIRYCEEKGILIDVSHTNLKSFWDIAKIATKPFIATHSNAYAVSPVDRNLDDEQIRFLAEKGGTMGLNGANFLACYKDPNSATMSTLVDHVMHEKEIGGIGCVAVGLDQCEMINPYINDSSAAALVNDLKMFDIVPFHRNFPDFAEVMLERGLTEDEIKAIFGGNLLRVLKETIDK